jgi:aminopeptidase N
VGRRATARRGRAAVAALALVAACSTSGDEPPAPAASPEAAPPAGSPGSPGTEDETAGSPGPDPEGVDPTLTDVPDEVFPGLGDPRIDVDHYDVVVRADPGRPGVEGTASLTLSARTAEPLASFTLDLRGPGVTTATVAGDPAEVRVTDPNEAVEIEVIPATPLPPGEPVEVVLAYGGSPAPATFPGLGVPVGWQPDDRGGWFTLAEPDGTSTWAPVSDHPSDKATWTITLDTPADATGVANGRLVSEAVVGDRREWVWATDEPMATYVVLAAVGDYDLVERSGPDGIDLVFAFPPDLLPADRAKFDEIDEIIEYFTDRFGPYPADAGGAIVVDTALGLALETRTRPTFGIDAIRSDGVWALVHEVAHEWYGNAVTPATWADLWLNEGFAVYAEWLYLDHLGEIDLDAVAEGARRDGVAVTDPDAAATFAGAVYEGGARVLHALRLTIGDDAFDELLRRWFADHVGGDVTTADLVALAEELAGRDLETFFGGWLDEPVQPPFPE